MRNSKRVMLVEDDAVLSFVGEKLIISLGFEVVDKAASGEEAIDKLSTCNPDILVMDIQLSGTLDGIQTVEKMRNHHINIPVIFLSGSDDNSLMEKAKEVNCVDYLVKPISAGVLLKPLQKAASEATSKRYHAA